MADFDPSDLIAICRIITGDGELTSDEVYKLAEYLNKYPEACDCWPGDVLSEVLRQVWHDGAIDEDELVRVAQLLDQIEIDFARRHEEELGKWLRSDSSQASSSQGLLFPVVPTFEWRNWHESHSSDDRYWVDLSDLSCTCPDWLEHRKRFPSASLGRCCKHIVLALNRLAQPSNSPAWLRALLAHYSERAKGIHPEEKWILTQLASGDVLVGMGWNEWANAFAPRFGTYGRWGFNKVEQRWAYGMAPDSARFIAETILSNDDGLH